MTRTVLGLVKRLPKRRKKVVFKQAWHIIGGVRKWYRSGWEANYAYYLEYLLTLEHIKKWEHEPETFWFESIRRGVRSYLPDFKVTLLDGSVEYHEVKGYMDAKSRTKLNRMAKYYPEIKMVLVCENKYKVLCRKVSAIVPGWK